jgi:hypothetical protein
MKGRWAEAQRLTGGSHLPSSHAATPRAKLDLISTAWAQRELDGRAPSGCAAPSRDGCHHEFSDLRSFGPCFTPRSMNGCEAAKGTLIVSA